MVKISFLFLIVLSQNVFCGERIIGVLNEMQEPNGTKLIPNVRVAFHQVNGKWTAYKNSANTPETLKKSSKDFPDKLSWQVCFDGKNKGALSSQRPKEYDYYSIIGTHSASSKFFSGKGSTEFAGWTGAEVRHPLVVVTEGKCEDPDEWKPAAIKYDVKAVAKPLREALAKRQPVEEEGAEMTYEFADTHLKLIKAYRSKSGSLILQCSVKIGKKGTDGTANETFVSTGGKTFSHLGSNLKLVDAGDYEGTGKALLVFFKADYNHDAYVLVSPELNILATFGWGYH